jgi:hypothetical protein
VSGYRTGRDTRVEEGISAREWGQTQARSSPVWPEEKWRRIGAIFGVDFIAEDRSVRLGTADEATAATDPDAA